MTKKKVIRNFGRENWKWTFFPEKIVISEILVRENFFRPPQTRRQVSGAACLWVYSLKLTLLSYKRKHMQKICQWLTGFCESACPSCWWPSQLSVCTGLPIDANYVLNCSKHQAAVKSACDESPWRDAVKLLGRLTIAILLIIHCYILNVIYGPTLISLSIC